MRYTQLGNTGLKVSVVGLGTNQFGGKVDQQDTNEIISTALDAGINFIDTANIYQDGASEAFIGKALRGRRHEMVLATKVGMKMGDRPNETGASRKHILDSVDESLRRLRTDYIDLYQIHRWDQSTPVQETLRALDQLVKQGKVRYIGVSNWAAWQLCFGYSTAQQNNLTEIASVQPHYNLLHRKPEEQLIPCCEHLGIGVIPYFPLAGGFLTGKYEKGEEPPSGSRGETSEYVQQFFTDKHFKMMDQLQKYAADYGYTPAQLAIAWLASHTQVSSVIAGVTSIEQLEANIEAADWHLNDKERQQILSIVNQR